ncbi:MAG: NADH-quinone oxidoreductase subunit NuoE [Gammaproteobacteria bacterium]|jgi:NADH-quinone oxidoreductase subunit E|nr:NADH-quinone oxidoreductase subunit NuoE [Gammaproteobacteria bacterium]
MSTIEKITLSNQIKIDIDYWLKKFPETQRQSALLGALHIVQDGHQGYLTDSLLEAVADYIGIPKIAVLEVASFYMMYDLKPIGKFKLYVCTNISCQLRGSDQIMHHLEKKLKIHPGETTKDGMFTLKEFECLGACTGAPMMQINKDYHENLTPEKVDQILANLK